MHVTLSRYSQGHVIRIMLFDARSGQEKQGISARDGGLSITYVRDDDGCARSLSTVPGAPGSYRAGGFHEVDAQTMPGLYELGLPDAVCAAATRRTTLMVRAQGIQTEIVHLDFVAYDPYDRERLGLDCLSREARHDVIATAFREVIPEIVSEFQRNSE